MYRSFIKFQSGLVSLIWVLGTQFLLLPFYHFHPYTQHSHPGKLSAHQHNAHFHSVELDRIAHTTQSQDHNSEVDHHHSHHTGGQDEDSLKIEFNKETLKAKNPFKVLKVSISFSSINFHQQLKSDSRPLKLYDFSNFLFQHQLRERSPPSLSI